MTGGQFDTSVLANEFYTQSVPASNDGPRRRARGAAVHPRHPDRRLQRPAAAQNGGPMSTDDAPSSRATAGRATRSPTTAAPGQDKLDLARGRRVAGRSSSRSCGRSRPSACSSRRSGPSGHQDHRLVDVLHQPDVHARQLHTTCSDTSGGAALGTLLHQLAGHHDPGGVLPALAWPRWPPTRWPGSTSGAATALHRDLRAADRAASRWR